MTRYYQRILLFLCTIPAYMQLQAQTTNIYTSSTTWTVPAGVHSISIKVYGGGGGLGGQDCGAGCSNAAAGNAGYVVASYNVSQGNTIGIYPGGRGTDGSNSVTNTGGGAGGVSPYNTAYNGGRGGNTGASGSSGGGGGGGAASIVTINSVIKIVAGGAGGGGGMANVANSGQPGSNSYSANGTSNTGGNGTTPSGDGGGGGGGGGGQYGSVGGSVYPTASESAGYGGYIGGNSISGAVTTTSNTNITWTSGGRIEITFISTLPVTWLGFTVAQQTDGSSTLYWRTATESDTKEFTIQSSSNGRDWTDIGTVAAAGNSSNLISYQFRDANTVQSVTYYRIRLTNLDGTTSYSDILNNNHAVNGIIRLSPNPVSGGVAVLSLQHASTVVLYNSTGVKLMEKYFPAGNSLLQTAAYPKGTYFLKTKEAHLAFVIQ